MSTTVCEPFILPLIFNSTAVNLWWLAYESFFVAGKWKEFCKEVIVFKGLSPWSIFYTRIVYCHLQLQLPEQPGISVTWAFFVLFCFLFSLILWLMTCKRLTMLSLLLFQLSFFFFQMLRIEPLTSVLGKILSLTSTANGNLSSSCS